MLCYFSEGVGGWWGKCFFSGFSSSLLLGFLLLPWPWIRRIFVAWDVLCIAWNTSSLLDIRFCGMLSYDVNTLSKHEVCKISFLLSTFSNLVLSSFLANVRRLVKIFCIPWNLQAVFGSSVFLPELWEPTISIAATNSKESGVINAEKIHSSYSLGYHVSHLHERNRVGFWGSSFS